MPLLAFVIVLVVIGVALYLIETMVPMDPAIKVAIRVIILLAMLLYLLQWLGLFGGGFPWGPIGRRP
jgi:hypothetical protein